MSTTGSGSYGSRQADIRSVRVGRVQGDLRRFRAFGNAHSKIRIAKDNKLDQPLPVRRVGDDESKPIEFYDPKDPGRFHIMPKGASSRGLAMWLALDIRNKRQHWVERRDLADRLLSLLEIVKGAGELEAEQNASAQAQAQPS